MGKSSAPAAPDPYQSADAQYEYGTAAGNYSTALQRPNVVTPYGSSTWNQSEPSPTYSGPNYTSTPTGYGGGGIPGYGGAAPSPGGGMMQPNTWGQPAPAWGGGSGEQQMTPDNIEGGSTNFGGGGGSRTGAVGPSAVQGGGYPGAPGAGEPAAPGVGNEQYLAYNGGYGGGEPLPGTVTAQNPNGVPNLAPPQYTESVNLSPEQQQLLNEQQGGQLSTGLTAENLAAQNAGSLDRPLNLQTGVNATPVQGQIDTNGVPGIAGANNLEGFTNEAQDAAYQQQTQYLNPQFQQQQESLDSQLKNSGAQPGSPAYDNAMKLFTNQEQQAYGNAAEGAISTGLNEQQALYGESANTNQQLFGQASTEQQAANAASGQQFGQEVQGAQFGNSALEQQRDEPLNEYETLAGGYGYAPNSSAFGLGGGGSTAGGGGAVAAPDVMSAFQNQYNGQLAGYNANVAQGNADTGAAATIAASLISYY